MTVTWVPLRTRTTGAPALGPSGPAERETPDQDLTDGANPARGARDLAPENAVAVAFAISRRVGSAVVRNRLRRRLRAELGRLARVGLLRSGCYLVSLQPAAAALDAAALRAHLARALGPAEVTA